MPTTPLLPLPDGLEITSISEAPDELLVRVTSNCSHSLCPLCGTPSEAIHSYYRRKPLDLPCTGRSIRLLLTVKKFFCRVAGCPRKVFTERIPELLQPSSRLTIRLRTAIQEVGFASCGKGGEHLCSKLGIRISDTTLLCSVLLVPTPNVEQVRRIGIDDWAWRRGHRYGTIIVDLDTRRVIDLLKDRSAESVQKWLEAHKEREIVSRDRGNVYIDGATQGAPLAQQVSDRWHLCKNIGDAVEEFLKRTRIRLPERPPVEPSQEPVQIPSIEAALSPSEIRQAEVSQQQLSRRQERCDQVKALHALGWSTMAIHEELGLDRKTIRKYLKTEEALPPRQSRRRASILDPYYDYLLLRWKQGCRNGELLLKEIRAKGYSGGASLVRALIARLRKNLPVKAPAQGISPPTVRTIPTSPRELRWLLAKRTEELEAEEQADLERLLEVSEEMRVLHSLLQSFLQMVRERKSEQLSSWLWQAEQSAIPELKSFVVGIERDRAAVSAALRLPWSQGPVEGNVNRLKTLKRQMYGKAGFALLRQRVLHRS
ncbi:MAG TPA: ISL3 family transposase [Ktedonosporobacter sp.]|nr:ISL3 family transposase [Ktedonosporobacter sp.]